MPFVWYTSLLPGYQYSISISQYPYQVPLGRPTVTAFGCRTGTVVNSVRGSGIGREAFHGTTSRELGEKHSMEPHQWLVLLRKRYLSVRQRCSFGLFYCVQCPAMINYDPTPTHDPQRSHIYTAGFTFEQDSVGARRNCTRETCHFLPTHNSPTIKSGNQSNLTIQSGVLLLVDKMITMLQSGFC